MKKQSIVIVIIVFLFAIILLNNNSSSLKKLIKKKDDMLSEVSDKLKPVYNNYQIDVDKKYNNIIFSKEDKQEIEYHFYDNNISSITIRFNLEDTTLTTDEIIQNIDELYQMVTSSFLLIENYFDDDFLIRKEYFMNDHDRSYLKDLLDYNVEYSGWNVGYDYEEDNHYCHIGYYLTTNYNHEGFSYFMIYLN